MLNKKAQTEDIGIEIPIAIILTIIGVIALTVLDADYKWSIDHAKNALQGEASIRAYDVQFMGTDLLNIAKLPLAEQSLGEALAGIEQSPSEAFIQDLGVFSCGTDLYTSLHAKLKQVYGENWYLIMEDEEQQLIFACTGIATMSYQFLGGETNSTMKIPSIHPDKEYILELGVLV